MTLCKVISSSAYSCIDYAHYGQAKQTDDHTYLQYVRDEDDECPAGDSRRQSEPLAITLLHCAARLLQQLL